jgi:predicted nucleic acid-binding protein
METIANTTIISNFAAVGRLDILQALLGQVHISTDVYAEIQDGLAEDACFYAGIETHVYPLSEDGWLRLTALDNDAELRLFGQLPVALHCGEASCLAIARQRGWAFLTDDARARVAARELGIVLSGTLGVLVQAIRRGILPLDEGEQLLDEMIKAGYRSPFSHLAELVTTVNPAPTSPS